MCIFFQPYLPQKKVERTWVKRIRRTSSTFDLKYLGFLFELESEKCSIYVIPFLKILCVFFRRKNIVKSQKMAKNNKLARMARIPKISDFPYVPIWHRSVPFSVPVSLQERNRLEPERFHFLRGEERNDEIRRNDETVPFLHNTY